MLRQLDARYKECIEDRDMARQELDKIKSLLRRLEDAKLDCDQEIHSLNSQVLVLNKLIVHCLCGDTVVISDDLIVLVTCLLICILTYYPHMPIGKVWVYLLLFCVCVCLYGYGFLR